MKTLRDELKSWIIGNSQSITNDCFALVEHRNEGHRTGGGNFLIPTGLFAVLNFLAKIYSKLEYPEEFVSAEERELVKTQLKLHKINPASIVILPAGASKSEERAFVRLIKTSRTIKIMDKTVQSRDPYAEELQEIWKAFRNKLAHFGRPGGPVITFGYASGNSSPANVREIIMKQERPSFDRITPKWAKYACYVDLLIRDVEKTAKWLETKINSFKIEEVEACLNWVKINLPA